MSKETEDKGAIPNSFNLQGISFAEAFALLNKQSSILPYYTEYAVKESGYSVILSINKTTGIVQLDGSDPNTTQTIADYINKNIDTKFKADEKQPKPEAKAEGPSTARRAQ